MTSRQREFESMEKWSKITNCTESEIRECLRTQRKGKELPCETGFPCNKILDNLTTVRCNPQAGSKWNQLLVGKQFREDENDGVQEKA